MSALITAKVSIWGQPVGAVPVESLMGETVAKLCPSCDQQLPARFVSLPIALNRASGQENAA